MAKPGTISRLSGQINKGALVKPAYGQVANMVMLGPPLIVPLYGLPIRLRQCHGHLQFHCQEAGRAEMAFSKTVLTVGVESVRGQ